MAKIKVPQLNKDFDADLNLSLMENLLNQGLPVASSCQGDGICGKCIVEVLGDSLPPKKELEEKTLQKAEAGEKHRLSCQLKGFADIQVKTTYW